MRGSQKSFAAILALVLASACTPLGLNTASTNTARQDAATPAILAAFGDDAPVRTAQEWSERRAPLLKAAFEEHLYGPVPVELKGREAGRRVVAENFREGGPLEEIDVAVGDDAMFRMAVAWPKGASADNPVPVIIWENFCGNIGAMGAEALSEPFNAVSCRNEGMMSAMIRLIFGKYIIEAPVEQITSRGYALATIFPGEVVADSADGAPLGLARFEGLLPEARRPSGAIAVWATEFAWAIDVLDQDPRLDASRTAAFGHSRQGKAALLAAAFDPRIEVVLPLQSGKGGATLTRSYAGESVKQITDSYGFWFAPAYAAYADREAEIPVDQHQLLALVAPRPVMLGNGWKDVWSDPNGSFRAALGADPVYRLFGADGLRQATMQAKEPHGELDWFIREGGHGIRAKDWDAMLDFCDRWLTAAAKTGPDGSAVAAP
jgi:hypothetical protein